MWSCPLSPEVEEEEEVEVESEGDLGRAAAAASCRWEQLLGILMMHFLW